MRHFLRWFHGYLYIRLKGIGQERFLNLCNSNEIMLKDLHYCGNGYQGQVLLKDFWRLRPLARKSGVVPYIIKRKGFPFLLRQCRVQLTMVAGMLLFLFLLFYLSGFLWKITIEGEYRHTEEQLMRYLDQEEVYLGASLDSIDCAFIEERMRLQFPDIGWVSAEIKGTCLTVRINESVIPDKIEREKETNLKEAHIVAAKDGIITSILARDGEAKVRKGDVVKKGDLLISGVINIVGDNELIVNRYPVLADGSIKMNTYYEYKDVFPLDYVQRITLDRSRTGYEISLFGKKLFSYNSGNLYEQCDIIAEVKNFKLFDDFYLPFQYTKITETECKEVPARYTKDEARKIAEERLLRYQAALEAEGTVIQDQNLEFYVDGDHYIVMGKIMVEESAWEYKGIYEDEWRMESTDELDGNNN